MEMFYGFVPEEGWLCSVSSGKEAPFIVRRSDERRYKAILYKKAELEMAAVRRYTCRGGTVFTVLTDTDEIGARRVINGANASYSKYKKLLGEETSFAPWEPKAIQTSTSRGNRPAEIFHALYVADRAREDV